MSRASRQIQRSVAIAILVVIAAVICWRILVTGVDAVRTTSDPGGASVTGTPLEQRDTEAVWRKRIARNPADYGALLTLALQFEQDGKKAAALDAATLALRLAPADQSTLTQTANLFLRLGDDASALAILRRFADLYPGEVSAVWPVFSAALDSGRHGEFFGSAARDGPLWWPAFFHHACGKAALAGVQSVFTIRAGAGTATIDERRCLITRLQREGRWTAAHQFWLNSLPAEQRQRVGFVFNGGFEVPLSNLGFDWLTSTQDGVTTAVEFTEGASGRRALHVTFINKRYNGAPVYEYLLLHPGRYRFEGRGRADGLNTWLGVQWGLYCHDSGGGDARQLAHSDPLLGSSDWTEFQQDFAVGRDCPVQILRLELANPRRDATSGGSVAVRLRGSVWFDDLRVRILD